ncbi:MAG: polymerase sigma-70 factor [Clostridia bacterium]|jgi:RNA polymerase sigma-70 factor (ECF subfamily)|nr:polymerase sigma-70 factor [Clostridia bacterium]
MEEQIIDLLQKKQAKGIDLLMDRYSNLIYGVIYSMGHHQMKHEDIEECYNDVIFNIWSKIDQYDSKRGTFRNWMISIIKFKTIDYIRKCKKLPRDTVEENDSVLGQSLEDAVICKENHSALKKAIQKLNKVDEKIFTWRYLDELSVEEISTRLNMTPQAVYTRISRSKGKLRKWIGGIYNE